MRGVFITDCHLTKQPPSSRIDDYLQTILDKIDWVCKFCKEENALLFIGGDIFKSPIMSAGVAYKFLQVLENNDIVAYVITGNHDVRFYSQDMVQESLLGLVYKTGQVVCLDNKVVELDGVTVGSIWFADGGIPKSDVVLSHRTYFNKKDRLYQDPEVFAGSDVKLVLAGHDHDNFPELMIGKTRLVRPGAIARCSAHKENIERPIVLAYFEVTFEDGVRFVKYIKVPHKPFDSIFFQKSKVDSVLDIDVGEIIALIHRVKTISVSVDPYDILDLMDIPVEVKARVIYHLEAVSLYRK